MPSEFRRVMFTNNELIEAIHDYNEVSRDKLPPGIILTRTPVSEAEVAVRLELVDQRSDETHLVERGRAAEHLGARRAWGANAVSAPVAKGAVPVAKGAERL